MIIFDRVTHYNRIQDPPILDDASFVLPSDRKIACFAIRGTGRTTLTKLVSGQLTQPKKGVISRGRLSVSFPLGPRMVTVPRNSVIQNLIDIARMHGYPQEDLIDFVVTHGDCEALLNRRLSTLNSGERSRVICPVSFVLPFDFYVADGDPFGAARVFRAHFQELFGARIRNGGLLLVENNPLLARRFCDMGAVLFEGRVTLYEDPDEAIAFYQDVMRPLEDALAPPIDEFDEPGLEELAASELASRMQERAPLPPPPGGVFL
ncbi:MAG: hypothetical protein AAFW46_11130 [Pseudomonadota bacterium]